MKKNKTLIIISILFIAIVSSTYAVWQAGGGVKWIGESETVSRFTGPTTIDGIGAYTDTWTGYKWEIFDPTIPPLFTKWAVDNTYPEPKWDGTSYIRSSATSEDGGHIVGTIISGSDTDYPAFAYCVNKGAGWRLPTKKEMFSIMTDVETNTSLKYTKLESIITITYWSSTANAADTTSAWFGDFGGGSMNFINEANYNQVLCIHD